jgi:hypothetical protein
MASTLSEENRDWKELPIEQTNSPVRRFVRKGEYKEIRGNTTTVVHKDDFGNVSISYQIRSDAN